MESLSDILVKVIAALTDYSNAAARRACGALSPLVYLCAPLPQTGEICMSLLAFVPLLIWIVLLGAHGAFWRVARSEASPEPSNWPAVIAIVPARDEAAVIDECVTSLLAQDYPGPLRVIVVDDHSSDGTAERARACAARLDARPRLTVVAARSLPSGWAGKVWAQAEGVAAAQSLAASNQYWWLTDADITHGSSVLRELIARAEDENRELYSLMVRLRTSAFAERALIPAFVFFFSMLYPFAWVNDPRKRTAAAAGGCMLVRVRALESIGGLAAIRDALIDDCALARAIKRIGSIRLDLALNSQSIRPYDSFSSIWNMIARSAFTQLRYSPLLLILTVLGMLLTYVAPPGLLLAGGVPALAGAMAWVLMSIAFLPVVRYYRLNPLWASALPLIALFYLGATLASAYRFWRGRGGQWKGRSQAHATSPERTALRSEDRGP